MAYVSEWYYDENENGLDRKQSDASIAWYLMKSHDILEEYLMNILTGGPCDPGGPASPAGP